MNVWFIRRLVCLYKETRWRVVVPAPDSHLWDVGFYADEFTEFDALRRRSNAGRRLSLASKFRADWDYFNLKPDVSTKWELRSGRGWCPVSNFTALVCHFAAVIFPLNLSRDFIYAAAWGQAIKCLHLKQLQQWKGFANIQHVLFTLSICWNSSFFQLSPWLYLWNFSNFTGQVPFFKKILKVPCSAKFLLPMFL